MRREHCHCSPPPGQGGTRGHRALALVIVLVGVGLSLGMSGLLWRQERENARYRFAVRAGEVLARLDTSVRDHQQQLQLLAGLFRARTAVSRDEFRAFASPLSGEAQPLQAVEWVPEVAGDARDSLEAAERRAGLAQFTITEHTQEGTLVPAARRPVYYPVLFLEPFRGNERALGYDLASEPTRKEALTQAAQSGEARATGRLHLVQGTDQRYGFLLFVPIHLPATGQGRLQGFVLGIYYVEGLVRHALSKGDVPELDLFLEDESAPPATRPLGGFAGRLDAQGNVRPPADPSEQVPGLTRGMPLRVGGRTWRAHAVARKAFVDACHTYTPALAGALGLAMTALVLSGYRRRTRQLVQFERLVDERTHELARNQSYLRAILDNQPNMTWLKDTSGRFLAVNQAFAHACGRDDASLVAGLTDLDVWPRDLAEAYRADDRQVLESGRPKAVEEPIADQGGTRWFETFKKPVLDASGQVIGTTGIARDVTERRRAEQALADALELNARIVEAAPLGIAAWSADGKCVLANEAMASMVGGTQAQLLEQDFRSIPSWSKSGLLAAAEETLASGERREFDLHAPSSFGQEVWLHCRFAAFHRQGARHLLLLADDVGAERKAQADLRWKEALLSQMASVSPLGFMVVDDRANTILYHNERFCEVWGFPEVRADIVAGRLKHSDLVGLCRTRMADPELYTCLCQHPQDVDDRGTTEEELALRDGRILRRFSAQIRDSDGAYLGRFYMTEDITRRKQEAQLLAQQKTLLAGLRDSIPDIVFFKDLDGVYLGCNPAFQELLGRSREDIVGFTDYDLFSLEEADFFRDQDRATMEQGTPHHNEEWVTYPDGRRSYLDTFKAPLRDESGRIIGLLGISRDITAKAGAEVALREAIAAAVEANAAKSEFLANMSHEIRSPMNGVIGAADLLLGTPLTQDQQELARIIKLSAGSLLSLINDILDLSKIEARRLDLESIPFEIKHVVDETVDIMTLPAAEKGLALHTLFEPQAATAVVGDPGRLRQVLLNLVGNAVKFTLHGHVTLQVRCEGESEGKIAIRFEVRDSGIGIPQEKLHAIFDVFTQVEASTSRRFGGTGLGLTIVRRLIEIMGGTLGLESQVDVGSRFWFTLRLPLAPTMPVPTPAEASAALGGEPGRDQAGRPRRLLIAEDNRVNQIIMTRIISNLGHEVVLVDNGLAVLETLRGDPGFDLILMDLQMPVLDGLETTRRIRAGEAGSALQGIPIVALTANALVRHRETCAEVGMDGFLTKPVEADRLAEALARWLPAGAPPPPRPSLPEHRRRWFDPDALAECLGGDLDCLREALEEFVHDLDVRHQRLEAAIASRNLHAVRQDAHAIKGAASYSKSEALREAAFALEQAAESQDPLASLTAFDAFLPVLLAVKSDVEEWLATR